MREYKPIISLSKNNRGIWDLDTVKGCESGLLHNQGGCYGDCYAYKTAKRYGIDFSKSINRHFRNKKHLNSIIKKIEKIDMPFIRIGCSGDPSEDWDHTIYIINQIRNNSQLNLFDLKSKKQIVIITRHWNVLTDKQLNEMKNFNLVVNTSISALDKPELIEKCLSQYERIKPFCKSVLRVVTADFNLQNEIGHKLHKIQQKLMSNEGFIDTVFRPSFNNIFLTQGIINAKKMAFMKSTSLVSKYNKKTFLGKCNNCLEMCGLNK